VENCIALLADLSANALKEGESSMTLFYVIRNGVQITRYSRQTLKKLVYNYLTYKRYDSNAASAACLSNFFSELRILLIFNASQIFSDSKTADFEDLKPLFSKKLTWIMTLNSFIQLNSILNELNSYFPNVADASEFFSSYFVEKITMNRSDIKPSATTVSDSLPTAPFFKYISTCLAKP